jgi:hypothetical protein
VLEYVMRVQVDLADPFTFEVYAEPATSSASGWLQCIVQGVAASRDDGPRSDDCSWVAAKELRSLSRWHFGA